jgi:hypothetical protein
MLRHTRSEDATRSVEPGVTQSHVSSKSLQDPANLTGACHAAACNTRGSLVVPRSHMFRHATQASSGPTMCSRDGTAGGVLSGRAGHSEETDIAAIPSWQEDEQMHGGSEHRQSAIGACPARAGTAGNSEETDIVAIPSWPEDEGMHGGSEHRQSAVAQMHVHVAWRSSFEALPCMH